MAKYNKSQLYFFKFPNTFFDSDEIEDILKDDDGPSIVILYLKLILLATNKMGYLGRIIAGELKPYTTEELYKIIKPEICLWPTTQRIWENNMYGTEDDGPWTTKETRKWMKNLNVKVNYLAFNGIQNIKIF